MVQRLDEHYANRGLLSIRILLEDFSPFEGFSLCLELHEQTSNPCFLPLNHKDSFSNSQ